MERESNMDFLKIIACLMVISIHISAGFGKAIIRGQPDYYLTVGNIFHAGMSACVPIFIMVTGGFLLSEDKNVDISFFYKKTMNKIIKPTIYWNIFYLFYSLIRAFGLSKIGGYENNYGEIIKKFFSLNSHYHLWYMSMIIAYYLITPNLISIKNRIGKEKFFKIGILILFIGIIEDRYISVFWNGNFLKYLGYYILGYSLKDNLKNKRINWKKLFLGYILMTVLIIYLTEKGIRTENNALKEVSSYLSPLTVVSSIFLYGTFIKISIRNAEIIGKISAETFNIYFVHTAIIEFLYIILKHILTIKLNPVIYIPSMIIVTFVLSFVFSYILNKNIFFLKKKKIFKAEER